jgi:hypothetical protein
MRLKADLEIVCWTSVHSVYAYLIALPALIAWGLGLPLLAFWSLTNNRAAIIKSDDEKVKIKLGFIYDGFKSDFYFWEIGILLRKLIIICIVLVIG